MGTELAVGLPDIERMADIIVKSGLFGYGQKKEQVLTLMLMAWADGIHPVRAMREYYVVNGRPAMRADAMLARFLAAGGRVIWHERSPERVSATFYRPGASAEEGVTITWTLEDAQRAGLGNGENWKKYPRQMLTARVISEGVRVTWPAVAVGIYTVEEVSDFEPRETPMPVQVVEATQAEATQVEATQVEVTEVDAQVEAPATDAQRKKIYALMRHLAMDDREVMAWAARTLSGEETLSKRGASRVIQALEELREQAHLRAIPHAALRILWAQQLEAGEVPHLDEEALADILREMPIE